MRQMKRRSALRISTPGSRPASHEELKAVADAEHQAAARGMGAHRLHDRRARRDRAAAQIIAIGEAARQHDEIGARRQRGSAWQTIAARRRRL